MGRAAPGGHDLADLRAILLSLLGGTVPAAAARLSRQDWSGVDRMAALHRLQPLLHHLHRDDAAIPADVRDAWREAFRHAALRALAASGELAQTLGLLEGAGLAPVALKGAWLAWHAYPHPALRPMRDIDLLLTPATVIPAYRLLLAQGYRRLGAEELPLEDIVRVDKHMPPLLSPRGLVIELHQRLWEIEGRMDHAAPRADEAAIRARAIRCGEATFLAPADLLAHLIIHAVYDHRLDCGPLVLSDVAWLLRTAPADWPAFWAGARAGGWERGAHLVLALAARHAPDLAISFPPDLPALPPGSETLAAALLLQELDTRQSAGFAATVATGGLRATVSRLLARRTGGDQPATGRNLSAEGGFAAWAGSRLARTFGQLARGDVRRQSRGLARLSRWLDS